MSLLERYNHFFLGSDRHGDNTSIRQKGSTTALISIMLSNPNAVMIVHSYDMARSLSKQYGIDASRFISIRDGFDRLQSRKFTGPVLVDVSAIGVMLTFIRNEQDNLLNTKDTKISECELLRNQLNEEKQKNTRLTKGIKQLIGKFRKINDLMEAVDVDLTPADIA